jgi:hypothetical protein
VLVFFAKSFAVKRGCVPEVLKTHQRRLFQDWAKAMHAASDSGVTEVVARKHWHTGCEFLKPILKAIFQDMGLGPSIRVHIQHYTLFSPELGHACMELNGERHKFMPHLAYTGVTFQPAPGAVAACTEENLKASLLEMTKSGKYVIPGAPVRGDRFCFPLEQADLGHDGVHPDLPTGQRGVAFAGDSPSGKEGLV